MLVVAVIVVVFDLIVLVGFLRFHHQNLDGCFEIAGGCSTAAVAPKIILDKLLSMWSVAKYKINYVNSE